VGLSEGEKHFIRGGIAQDIRTDGRRRLQFRALSVETGVIPQVGFQGFCLFSCARVPFLFICLGMLCGFMLFRIGACCRRMVQRVSDWVPRKSSLVSRYDFSHFAAQKRLGKFLHDKFNPLSGILYWSLLQNS
jgi:hypothetical protein